MGYRSDGDIADLFREEPIRHCAERIRTRVGDDLRDRVRAHTPVATPPPGAWSEWLHARRRLPGTLRDSWEVHVHELPGERYVVDVVTQDPVAPYVEWDTEPHLIVPKEPGGVLRFWDREGALQFARSVHHPGTRGQHMMAKALAEVAVSWKVIAEEEFREMARTYHVA